MWKNVKPSRRRNLKPAQNIFIKKWKPVLPMVSGVLLRIQIAQSKMYLTWPPPLYLSHPRWPVWSWTGQQGGKVLLSQGPLSGCFGVWSDLGIGQIEGGGTLKIKIYVSKWVHLNSIQYFPGRLNNFVSVWGKQKNHQKSAYSLDPKWTSHLTNTLFRECDEGLHRDWAPFKSYLDSIAQFPCLSLNFDALSEKLFLHTKVYKLLATQESIQIL